ncbi:MAG: hypothetical protein Q9M23_01815, partial [Mariprofundaceae bacterium]|nr:hypothetical protein [Mariprofundaceae bacterium]
CQWMRQTRPIDRQSPCSSIPMAARAVKALCFGPAYSSDPGHPYRSMPATYSSASGHPDAGAVVC